MKSSLFNNLDGLSKELVLAGLFFLATPLVIFSSLFSLLSLAKNTPPQKLPKFEQTTVSGVKPAVSQIFSALPTYDFTVSSEAIPADARSKILKNYLEYYQSPLAEYASYLVLISDRYGLDYRLLIAIAQQESNLCKVIPADSYNCWGWGIHSQGTLGFASFDQAIETVAKGLKENYLDKGYSNPEEIMAKYTPQSPGSWALGVSHFMEEMEAGVE